ncbi:MAG: hypothetical protein IE931_11900 [Sphingobacteriales bacterium]|nr:hypothetical protein [Sphingobacteriales bacterium]
MLKYAFLVLFIFSFLQSKAQQRDSILSVSKSAKSDTSKNKLQKIGHEIGLLFKDSTKLQNPRKALLRSAIIPGWGQARNHKWWKVPLVYGGFVGLGLVYEFNNRYYKEFLTESQFRSASATPDKVSFYPQYLGIPAAQIYSAKDFYRRNRDLTLYASIGFYGLQMLDAYIDARFATFDVGDDLSFKIKPSIYIPSYAATGLAAPIPMLTLKINL